MRMRGLALTSCVASMCLAAASCADTEPQLISPIFGVCMRLPPEASYTLNTSPPVDWDDGVLTAFDASIDVYVGLHPDYNEKLSPPKTSARNQFRLFDFNNKNKIDDFLYVHYADDEFRFPVYVMLSGDEIGQNRDLVQLLEADGFIFQCKETDFHKMVAS